MKSQYSYYVEPFELKDRPRRFLDAFAAIIKYSNYGPVLDAYSRLTAKCSRCSAACPIYLTTNNIKDVPCWRSELVLRVYRRYFTISGMIRTRLWNGFTLTDDYIDQLAEELYHCTACRRCKFFCPMGIDHGMITHIGRWALAEIGIVPKALVVATREQLEGRTHNTSAIPLPALQDTCEFLEGEIMEKYGQPVKFPIDNAGAEMVFFPAVSDYLLEPDTLMGNAAVMHATGGSWTIGSKYYDGINYGLFYSDRMMDRIVRMEVAEVTRLKSKIVLIGECGHASRSAKVGIPNFFGHDAPPVINIMEYTLKMLEKGKLNLRANTIKDRVTYHDPCNIARSGWIVNQPREILRAICSDFVDMTPNGPFNYCCGGGSGTVSIDEIRKWRTGPAGKVKARQIKETGARYVVAPCANCKKQLREVLEDNGLEDVEVVGLHDLVIKAIDFGTQPKDESRSAKEKL